MVFILSPRDFVNNHDPKLSLGQNELTETQKQWISHVIEIFNFDETSLSFSAFFDSCSQFFQKKRFKAKTKWAKKSIYGRISYKSTNLLSSFRLNHIAQKVTVTQLRYNTFNSTRTINTKLSLSGFSPLAKSRFSVIFLALEQLFNWNIITYRLCNTDINVVDT